MPSGISERKDAAGRTRYQVRVRRAGRLQTATLPTLQAALAWRAVALDASDGNGDAPTPPQRFAPEPAGRVSTVEEASRRLCRGMVDGSIRSRDGRPFKPSVCRKYEEALRLLVLPRIGAVPIATLTGGDVQRLVDGLAAERTAEHARKALTALRVALRVAQRYGELEQNPCAGVRVPVDANGEKPARILTHEEAVAIIAAADAEDVRLGRSFAGPAIALAIGAGLRLGELLALRWGPEGLDLDAGVVRVRASLDRVRDEQGVYAELAPKSRASRRAVPLAPEDAARLRKHLLASGRPGVGVFVLSTAHGEALSPVPVRRAFRRACWRAGIFTEAATEELRAASSYAAFQEACRKAKVAEPLPRLHDCRHAFASHALAAGLTAHAVAKLLGHSDAGLVLRRYGHALPDELEQAGATLSAWRNARTEQNRNMAASKAADLQG